MRATMQDVRCMPAQKLTAFSLCVNYNIHIQLPSVYASGRPSISLGGWRSDCQLTWIQVTSTLVMFLTYYNTSEAAHSSQSKSRGETELLPGIIIAVIAEVVFFQVGSIIRLVSYLVGSIIRVVSFLVGISIRGVQLVLLLLYQYYQSNH